LEFCERGDLAGYLDRMEDGVEEIVIWGILGQVAQGLKQIHELQIIHLDLKPSNIMISGHGLLKIGDFGCATMLPVAHDFEREGDRTYIAPEVMESKFGPECDVFSLGLIIFEIATNVILPENGNHWQKLRRHDFSEATQTMQRVSPPLVELIKGMLHPVVKERFGLGRILGHPFVGPVL
ncbi:kinase-like domain-containing protein, partial [Chytriomyces sp. MP71]